MANEFAPNLQDASLNPATFTLPSAASTSTTSAVIDLGADTAKLANVEIELAVPALTTTINPGTSTAGVTYVVETSDTDVFTAIRSIIRSQNFAGDTTTALVAKTIRAAIPSNCERYVRGKVTLGTTTADASALAATVTVRFGKN
jgi:hypothetical protein